MSKHTIRAGSRVKMTKEGDETFPSYIGRSGTLEGYDDVDIARVRFDRRRSAIQIHASYLELSDAPVLPNRETPADRRQHIVERRKVLRAAFDIVRYDPAEKPMARRLASALGGSEPITETLMDSARQIISEKASNSQ